MNQKQKFDQQSNPSNTEKMLLEALRTASEIAQTPETKKFSPELAGLAISGIVIVIASWLCKEPTPALFGTASLYVIFLVYVWFKKNG